MTKRTITILMFAIAMLTPTAAVAQSDGGGKKKKAKTEQTIPAKKTTNIQQKTKHKSTTGSIAGHEWVDLGLPSGLKWATCNVGASSPEESGIYFAWGETTSKDSYNHANSLTRGKFNTELCSQGIIGDNSNLTTAHDAARSKWGNTWRIPTKSEFEELENECKWIWTSIGGHNGYKITGKNGNSIFLPAAGSRFETSLRGINNNGMYWSSTPQTQYEGLAYCLSFDNSLYVISSGGRIDGLSIRPISE